MRNCLLIFISAIHLLGNTELGELLKFPRLISHYLQHHGNDSTIDFIDFIAMHYVNGNDGTSNDDRQDEQLPCHNIKQQHSFSQTLTQGFKFHEVKMNQPLQTKVFGGNPQDGFSTGYVTLILQPPRV